MPLNTLQTHSLGNSLVKKLFAEAFSKVTFRAGARLSEVLSNL